VQGNRNTTVYTYALSLPPQYPESIKNPTPNKYRNVLIFNGGVVISGGLMGENCGGGWGEGGEFVRNRMFVPNFLPALAFLTLF